MRIYDNNTIASTQGQINISNSKYEKYFGIKVRPFLWHKLWFISKQLPNMRAKALHYNMTLEQFKYGDIIPSIIIDKRNGLIGVFTSLTASGNVPTPVLKIMKERLDLIDSYSRITNNQRFAAAAYYSRTEESWKRGCWNDFHPIIVNCLAMDNVDCNIAFKRIKPLAWECLALALNNVEDNSIPGLYYVDVPEDMVLNAF